MDPAQPPINDNISNKKGRKFGHEAKSCVAKPVVVAIETVWNKPWIRLSDDEGNVLVTINVTQVMIVARTMTALKKDVSESCR